MIATRICRKGFSLVELSIVIVVIALIVGFGINLGSNALKAAERVTTQERIAVIKNVLDTHFRNYGYLPCPYDRRLVPTSTAFGVEARAAVGAACTTSAGLVSASSGTVMIGGLPVRALGLPDSYAADAWGNKFTYAVTASMTRSAASYYTAAPGIQISAGDRTGTNYVATTDIYTLAAGKGAAYVVVSHGPDGRGAYPLTLNTIAIACGVAGAQNDVGNCNDSAAFYDTAYNDGTNDSLFFDDYVVWGSNAQAVYAHSFSVSGFGSCTGTSTGNCEAWCAPCGGAIPHIPGTPAAVAGGLPAPHLCRKILTSSTPCVATCVWSGKTHATDSVVNCP